MTMSTRCNIILKNGRDKLIFYRHSDGYPDGALPTLKKFMRWVKEGSIRDNVDQAAGWLILIGAREYDKEYIGEGKYRKKADITRPGDPNGAGGMGWKCGSYEPTTCIHGDIEFLYTLDLKKKEIKVQSVTEYTSKPFKRLDKPVYVDVETITDFTEEPDESDEEQPDIPIVPVEQTKPSRFEGIDVR